jgi:plastocyanin
MSRSIRKYALYYSVIILLLNVFALPTLSAQQPTGPAPAEPSVSIEGFAFLPKTLTIEPGQSVTWTNKDASPHTVTSTTSAFDSSTLSQNQTFQHQFTSPGSFSYFCAFHPGMTGTIIVQGPEYKIYLPITTRVASIVLD